MTAGSGNALTDAQREQIDAIFAEWDTTRTPGAAVGIYRHGELIFSRGYGMSNLEHGVPIRGDSIFHIASISKQFTATCIALLHQEGRISLDHDVREYVPEVPDFGQGTITIRHLVHHTSGLRDQWDLLSLAGWRSDDLITDQDVINITTRQRSLNFAPGDDHLYCNTGYTLQGIIIKRVTGLSLREFAQERIFGPLGMTRSHFHNNHSEIVPGRTQAYLDQRIAPGSGPGVTSGSSGRDSRERYRISIPVFDTTGTTSLFTTVEDFFKWDQNYEHGQVAGDLLELRTTPGVLNSGKQLTYAFGLVVDNHRGVRTFNHSGGDAGYRSHYLRIPEQRLGVTVFCNLGSMNPGALLDQVVDVVLGEGIRTPAPAVTVPGAPAAQPIELERATLQTRTGVYRSTTLGEIQAVVLDDTDGSLHLPMWFNLRLEALDDSGRSFRTAGGRDFRLTFVANDDGNETVRFAYSPQANEDDIVTYERIGDLSAGLADVTPFVGNYRSEELDSTWTISAADADSAAQRPDHGGDGEDEAEADSAAADALPDATGSSTLELTRPRRVPTPLRHITGDTFVSGDMLRITFTRNDADEVNGLVIGGIRVREMHFTRE